MEKYVYDGVEVVATGRTARRKAKRTTSRGTDDSEVLIEIECADKAVPVKWKKWVSKTDLFEIEEANQDEESNDN